LKVEPPTGLAVSLLETKLKIIKMNSLDRYTQFLYGWAEKLRNIV
jgi:hypothetical protein